MDTVIAVHLKGTFACSKFAALAMSQQGSGRIINITSGSGWQPAVGQTNYGAAKAGILGFTFTLALELARYNITVNAVWPLGLTRMNMPLLERILERGKEEALRTNSPIPSALELGYGGPEMVAPIVVYLASDEAKDITGKVMHLGGEKVAVFSRNEEIASATMIGGWSVEELRKRFRLILSKAL